MTVGEAVIDRLERRGVDTVFGIPGIHTIELYRGLAASGIRHVTPRHEQGAAFMADGYARTSGRPGVCLLITGPGVTNAITAMAQARADRIPMLVISGVNRCESLGKGRGHLHELPDQAALVATVALSTVTLTEPGQLDEVLEQAFATLRGPRPGPVHIEIPIDVTSAPFPCPGTPAGAASSVPFEPPVPAIDLTGAAAACRMARRPTIIAGGGCVRAADAMRRLSERIDAPLVSTTNARGLLAGHALDVPASPSLDSVRRLLGASDLVIAIGTEMGPTDHDLYERGHMPAPAHWIRVDIDPAELAREPRATQAIRCDAERFAIGLVDALGPDEDPGSESGTGASRARGARVAAFDEIGPDYRALLALVASLWRALPDATIVGDSTQPIYAGNLYVEAPRARSWFDSATGFGTLGYAPPASIGAWLGDPGRPVVCLVGDGGLQFSLAELGSAHDLGADVAFVVWNNSGYLEIEKAMLEADIVPVGVRPSPPDFMAIAAAWSLPARRVSDGPGLERALSELSRPCLIEFDAHEFDARER